MRLLMSVFIFVFVGITATYSFHSVNAQEPVDALSDLVGAKAGQAENAIKDRGYTWVKTDKSGGSAYSYWRESGSNKCVTIRTADGRYQSIVYAPDFDCETVASTESASVSTTVEGKCRLYNEKSNRYRYEGSCEIEQDKSDGRSEYKITLGNGDFYHFVPQGAKYKVEMRQGWSSHLAAKTEMGNVATFEWYKWKLSADTGDAPETMDESSTGADDESANSAVRAGQGKFDATGKIPCAQAKGQPMGQCSFGVARDGGGTATVSVSLPDGRKRAIFFENGKPTGADLSQADGNMDFSYTKEADLYMIKAGNERYEIPEAVIYGG